MKKSSANTVDIGQKYETKFRSQLKSYFKSAKKTYFTYKNPDFRSSGNNNQAMPDRLIIYQGMSWLIEIKHTNSVTSFPLANIPNHQIGYLLAHKQKGHGKSYIVIYNPDNEKGLFIDVHDFTKYFIKNPTKKSITFKELDKISINANHLDIIFKKH